ncbi:short-chain dehydrogenase/reductase [Reticulibacter mediterranei]|uniref:Short-chain dehydrogenase/reductase n=1 Tax=Reticulibacter mediterranei TaxID=2778369 RepID=A0A8J3MYJ1_9CHLR|nr:SDR family oxidoreductase [Reticulibacter mediterranei]GHO90937.1 short-chain dehydrogenase/reductase [Reticulibacter mediterranei]
MKEKIGAVLVTGASSGMGKACALRLAQAGYSVFAGVRKERDAQLLKQEGSSRLIPVILDVTDEQSIAAAREVIRETVGADGLVGLVNNAGVGVTAPIELVPLQELRGQFEINVIGQVAVIQAFLPLIRAARGRILNVGSVGGKITIPFGGPLCSSKYAIESINDALRMELRPWGIHVVLVAPGSIRTPAVEKLVADSEVMVNTFSPEGKARYAASYRAFVQSFLKQEEEGVGPEVMAETVYHALTVHTPRNRYPVGPKARLLPFLGTWLPAGVLDVLRTRMFHVYQPFGKVTE